MDATWVQIVVAVLGAVATTSVAIYAIRRQGVTSRQAIETQTELAREALRHERDLAVEQRLWNRKADLYMRIAEAMRHHVQGGKGGVDEEGNPCPAPEVRTLALLSAEAEILGSERAKDLLAKFVYDNPSIEAKIDLWTDFTILARAELAASPFGYVQVAPRGE